MERKQDVGLSREPTLDFRVRSWHAIADPDVRFGTEIFREVDGRVQQGRYLPTFKISQPRGRWQCAQISANPLGLDADLNFL
jgi:hypothetical protein